MSKVQSSADYEYFSGSAFAPAWKLGRSGSKAIFVDLAGTRHPTITYIPDLDRYLLTVAHSTVENSAAHKMGIFEAPNPWGPWRTVSYVDNFLGMTGGIFYYMNFPLKWQADNGATLWATFSCYSRHSSEPCGVYHDRFNLMKATLDVVPEPPPPTAVADEATTNANTPVLVPVLGNDTGSELTVRTVSTPTNGTARINTDRTVTYTPKTGYTGSDAFTYLISDGFEQPATATVTITVLNRPPVAAPDNATTVRTGVGPDLSVLANDSDPDGHSLTIAGATTAAHGTTTISSDRKAITYKPAAGYSGSDSFTYTVSDNHGGTGQGVVTVAANNRLADRLGRQLCGHRRQVGQALGAGERQRSGRARPEGREGDGGGAWQRHASPPIVGRSPTNRPSATSAPTASPTPPATAMAARPRPW